MASANTGLSLEPGGVKLSNRRQEKLEAELDRHRRFTECGQVDRADAAMTVSH